MEPVMARKMWRTLEPYHGLVYFAPEATAAYEALGVPGFGGYFASRAAPMGAVSAGVVQATFFNFHPDAVRKAIPSAWDAASPADLLAGRLAGIDQALRRCVGDALDGPDVASAAELTRTAVTACSIAGRPLFAGHAGLTWPDAPHLALWHGISLLREFRGDGHIACLVDAGLDGLDALIFHAASGEVPQAILQASRRWSDEEWAVGVAGLAACGLVEEGDGSFTADGAALRQHIEDRTDVLALAPWEELGQTACDELRAIVRPLSKAVVQGGGLG